MCICRRLTSEEHAVLGDTHDDLQELMFQRHLLPRWTLLLREQSPNSTFFTTTLLPIRARFAVEIHMNFNQKTHNMSEDL